VGSWKDKSNVGKKARETIEECFVGVAAGE